MDVIRYVAEKISNFGKREFDVSNIHPHRIEEPKEIDHHVGADASRNKSQFESLTLFAIRSFSISNKKSIEYLHVDVVPVPRAQDTFLRFIMEALEHRTLAKHIDDEDPKMVFIDGSLMTPAGIMPQYPEGTFAKEYEKFAPIYDRYLERFNGVIEKTYRNLDNENFLKVALFNLQFEDFNDEYSAIKHLHEKVVKTLTLEDPAKEVFNFIQFLAYYEYLYETNRLYEKTFQREHAAISKTSIMSYLTSNYLDKAVVRAAIERENAYPAMVPFEIKIQPDSKPGIPAYIKADERFPYIAKVYKDPPLAAYYTFTKTSPVYILETYNDIEEIMAKTLYVSPPPTYYPKVLEFAHHGSKITTDFMKTIVDAVWSVALAPRLKRPAREPLM